MGFQTGLSGLNAASKNLDVIGHNVANSATVGFKSGQAQFADVFAASLSGGGASQVGIGTKVANVAQQFTQGNITSTNNPLDLAINGAGFFQLSNNGAVTYTRNGQFQLDKNNYIVATGGQRLQGYGVDTNNNVTGALGDMMIPTASLPPQMTGKDGLSLPGTGAKIGLNLDSRSTIPTSATFSPTDAASYNKSTSFQVYDSLGNAHTLALYFTKTAIPGTWDLNANVDGAPPVASTAADVTTAQGLIVADVAAAMTDATTADTGSQFTTEIAAANAAAVAAAALPVGTADEILAAATAVRAAASEARAVAYAVLAQYPSDPAALNAVALADTALANANVAFVPLISLSATQLTFDTSGKLTSSMPLDIDIDLTNIGLAQDPPLVNNAESHLKFNLDFTGSTQFGSAFAVNSLTQDGYAPGELAGFSFGDDGSLQGRYTNGQSKTLGMVALGDFANPQGLQQMGDNQWAESPNSGPVLMGSPGNAGLGLLQSSSTEDSNVDLTQELVNMIVAQRAYQANAQTIKTQDAIQQTLMNLR